MRRKKKNIVEIRLHKLAFLLLSMLVLLIFRLYWIQIANHNTLKSQALKQRANAINLYPNRGIIYDMNLIPLTNSNRINTIFIPKDSLEKQEELKDLILKYTDISREELEDYEKKAGRVLELPLKKYIDQDLIPENAIVAEKTIRYSKNNILSHVIGYVNRSDNKGAYGIEKVYDDILSNNKRRNTLYMEFNDSKDFLIGGEFEVTGSNESIEPAGVKLTIDYHIQDIVEKILDKNKVNGAVIVADIKAGEIRALASRPNFDQNNIEEYLDREDMALFNKAIQVGYPPGSLFKIIVLITALEENKDFVDRTFYCKGYEEVGNTTIGCNKTEGHGYLSLKEGFSKSCNSVFIQLGKELGSEKIMNMAKRLGFGQIINIGLSDEVEGNLPSGNEIRGPIIGNISIGQGSIEVTPLQMTNLLMIIANDGIQKGLTIVDGITSENGQMVKKYNRKEDKRVINEEYCQIVKDYLIDVVRSGTARSLDLDEVGGAAGKTGSAQGVLNGEETIHGWFIGYYPERNPKYVITVFVEDAKDGSQSAIPIFEQIVKEIYKLNR
ncbi:MAG: hypothetical protein GX080_08925 [Tissierellia bacterium]|nr:hypothetical protein [Tissierellia bacterium]